MTRAAVLLLTAACVQRVPPPFPLEGAHLRVTLHIPRTGPVGVRLQMAGTHWPGPAKAAFTGLPERHLTAVAPRPDLDGPPGTPLDLSYEVTIPSVEDTPEGPALYGAFDTPGGRHLALNALIPVMESRADADRMAPVLPAVIEIESELPITSSLPGSGGVYWATEQTQLYHAIVLAGRTAEAQGSAGLRIVSFDYDAAALERLASLERRASAVLERSHGPREPLPLVVVHKEPKQKGGLFLAGVNAGGATVSMFASGVPDGRATSMTGNVLLHELIHSYQPPDKSLPHWITEGFTEYFAHRLGLTLDGLPEDALYGGLEGLWDAFVLTTPGRRASESSIGDYFGGAVLAFCIDTRLRKDHSSLEDVLAKTRRRAHGAVANALWEQEIAVASAPAGALVLNAKTEPIDPVQTCFKEAGLVRVDGPPALSEGYAAELFGMRSIETQPRHYDVLVGQTVPNALLHEGDAIVSVDGERVTGFGKLREALYLAQQKGSSTVIDVSRNGTVEKLTVSLPAPRDRGPSRRVWRKP